MGDEQPATVPPLLAAVERDVVLATGRTVRVRAAVPDDVGALGDLYRHLSDASSHSRFFTIRREIPNRELSPVAVHDLARHVALVAEGDDGIIGIGEYFGTPGGEDVEVAFTVADEHHNEGVATILLEDLAVLAHAAGFRTLTAYVLPTNSAMCAVFRTVGLVHRSWFEDGVTRVELDLTAENLLQDHADLRDWGAVVRSMQPILRPQHVVVVGVSRTGDGPGCRILQKLVTSFSGRVSVVHPSDGFLGGVDAVRSVGDLDGVPDLAIIAVPAPHVARVVDDCGQAGVPAAVIVSAGFAERDITGAELQEEVLATARRHGMRIVGPNCLGVVATSVGLDATFADQVFHPGGIAVAAQSGGVGIAVAAEAARRHAGISSFVSMGNKADVSGNDLLRLWADDDDTRVVLLYLESFGDPVRFARIARAVSRRKPVVALKGGRSAPGRRGAQSHTAAIASDQAAVDALLRHTGVLRAGSLEELIDVGLLLDRQPPPAGNRVALIGNAGGPLILAADAGDSGELEVPELSASLRAEIGVRAPSVASTANPVDLSASVSHEQLVSVVEAVASSGEVDACVVVWVGVDSHGDKDVTESLAQLQVQIPIAVAAIGCDGDPVTTVPSFPTPERAAKAVAIAAGRATWLKTIEEDDAAATQDDLGPALAVARRIVRREDPGQTPGAPTAAGSNRRRWLPAAAGYELLATMGIPVAPWQYVRSAAECERAAQMVGSPCVVKADAEGLVHKSDEGAVILGLYGADAAGTVYRSFEQRFGERLHGALVQAQSAAGLELLIGVTRSPSTGPVVIVGAGGVDAELRGDNGLLVAPIAPPAARRAIESLKLARVFAGYRARPPLPIEPVVDVIHRLSLLAAAVPEIVELDVNPLVVDETGCVAVDVRVAVDDAASPLRPLRGLRGQPS